MGKQPTAAEGCGVTELLERVLDKGLVINADLIISLSGIPLVGVNLKAAIAGMETMLKYGMLDDWDRKIRDWARKEREQERGRREPLKEGEKVLLKIFGSHWYSREIYRSWRPGHLYVTDRRVLLWRSQPGEVLLEIRYDSIKGMKIERKQDIARKETDYLYILLKDGEVAKLHPTDASLAKGAIEKRMGELGLKLEKEPSIPLVEGEGARFLTPGEEITLYGKMWHLLTIPALGRTTRDEWRSGHLYLTNKRLFWYYEFDGRIVWETSRGDLIHAIIRLRDLESMVKSTLKSRKVLNVLYKARERNEVASFSGSEEELKDWEDALSNVIRQRSEPLPEDWETCPRCGEGAPRDKLLKEGCSLCGWISPRLRRKV